MVKIDDIYFDHASSKIMTVDKVERLLSERVETGAFFDICNPVTMVEHKIAFF